MAKQGTGTGSRHPGSGNRLGGGVAAEAPLAAHDTGGTLCRSLGLNLRRLPQAALHTAQIVVQKTALPVTQHDTRRRSSWDLIE